MAPPPDYRQLAARKARQYGIPANVFLRQIGQESGFNPSRALGRRG
jgi:soluble lytic murein transglycosylase-like protein